MLTLITGGARSGKSTFAQSLCEDVRSVCYIAPASESDAEMRVRIQRHRETRPAHWRTVEEPLSVPEAIVQCEGKSDIVLLDCVTLWLSNLLYAWRDQETFAIENKALCAVDELISACARVRVVAVTNEVGSGLVPDTSVGRLFRDIQGSVNQRLARASDSVYLMTAGMPLRIK